MTDLNSDGVAALLTALPTAVRTRIEAAGLDAQESAALFGWPAEDGVLFAGSLADGTGGRGSDLDFVILYDVGPDFVELIESRGFAPVEVTRSTLIDRVLAVRGGIEFDLWFVSRAALAPLRTVLDASIDADGRLVSLPGLQYLETKLLTRLYNGSVLQGHSVVERWRQELSVSSLPAMRVAGGLVGALSFLEDAWSIGALYPGDRPEGDEFGCVIATRTAAEHLLQAALAEAGVLSWDLRYARRHRDRLAASGPVVTALRDLEQLLIPPAGQLPADYACRVLDGVLDLTDRLSDAQPGSSGRTAMDYLGVFVAGRFDLPIQLTAGRLSLTDSR